MSDLDEIREALIGEKTSKQAEEELVASQPTPKAKKGAAKVQQSYYQDTVKADIELMYPEVEIPTYAHEGDACVDLRCYRIKDVRRDDGTYVPIEDGADFEEVKIHKGWTIRFYTGIKVGLPKGWSAFIEARSGITTKHGLVLSNSIGEMDCPYRGGYIVSYTKVTSDPYTFKKGERIAQMKPMPQYKFEFNKVDKISTDTERGEGGLGDSGKM